jgi:prepilin-type N-terminal cleavage/methylation domain-containing protein
MPPRRQRPGFTLIELLVAIALLSVLAGLAYVVVPGMLGNYRRVSAVDQVSGWLLTARQRARRDGLPTGLRLLPATDDDGNVVLNADGSVSVRQLQYVQQPEPLVGGSVTSRGPRGGICVAVRNGVAGFRNVDFTRGSGSALEYLVQPGDYLEIRGGGGVHRVAGVTADQLLLTDPTVNEPRFTPTPSWRILRQPQPLPGEMALDLPGETVIDLGPPTAVDPATKAPLSFRSPAPTRCVNVPERLVGGGKSPPRLVLEIIFSPGGAVLSQHPGKVILWLRDADAVPPDLGSASLIAIPVSTGFIGAYDVAPGGNPYRHTESGRGSGL